VVYWRVGERYNLLWLVHQNPARNSSVYFKLDRQLTDSFMTICYSKKMFQL
jgi:hypothetical protein